MQYDNLFSYPSWYGEYTLFPEHATSKGSVVLELWEMTEINSHLELRINIMHLSISV